MRIVTRFSVLNPAPSSRCLIVLLLCAQEFMELFVPICGHKQHHFTGLTSTIGNAEELRRGGGGCTRGALLWVAAGAREAAAAASCAVVPAADT